MYNREKKEVSIKAFHPTEGARMISPELLGVSLQFLKQEETSLNDTQDKEGIFLGMCASILTAKSPEDLQIIENAWIKLLGRKVKTQTIQLNSGRSSLES